MRKNIINYSDRQLILPLLKDDKKKDDADQCSRSFDRDTPITNSVDSIESPSDVRFLFFLNKINNYQLLLI